VGPTWSVYPRSHSIRLACLFSKVKLTINLILTNVISPVFGLADGKPEKNEEEEDERVNLTPNTDYDHNLNVYGRMKGKRSLPSPIGYTSVTSHPLRTRSSDHVSPTPLWSSIVMSTRASPSFTIQTCRFKIHRASWRPRRRCNRVGSTKPSIKAQNISRRMMPLFSDVRKGISQMLPLSLALNLNII